MESPVGSPIADHQPTLPAAPDSFENLWFQFQKPLHYFVRSFVTGHNSGDPSLQTDDAVQEIMLKVYRSRDRFDPDRSERAWIYSIARNHCLDLRRRADVARRHLSEAEVTEVACARHQPPDELYLENELRNEVARFVATLGADDRSLLFLRFYEDLSHKEIAQVFGRPEGTIRSRIHELKRRLKVYMEDR